MSRVNFIRAELRDSATTDAQRADLALYLQLDAAFVYRWARMYQEQGGGVKEWLAAKFQDSAAHSARIAREALGIEPISED